jgi:hypothetical protein
MINLGSQMEEAHYIFLQLYKHYGSNSSYAQKDADSSFAGGFPACGGEGDVPLPSSLFPLRWLGFQGVGIFITCGEIGE